MRMKIKSIDFPDPIITALRNSELVVFAGAGVSTGKPAKLPDFKGLVKKIEEETGENKEEETEDQFLGRLHNDKKIPVHKIASEILTGKDPEPTELHHNLLRLYGTADKVRIVTTNFDLLFKQAARKIFKDSQPKIFSAPALPSGERFHGIVHIHGDTDNPSEMVLTDADFGRSYLTEGSARRFLVDLFQKHTVLFVGYSHNDPIMNYLARALPASNEVKRFALTEPKYSKHWQGLEIELIEYSPPQALDEGIKGLADTVNSSYWKQKVTEVAKRSPPSSLEKETEDIIKYGFKEKDKELIRFFTVAARLPEWIDWLNDNGYLNNLFCVNKLKTEDIILANWLAENFACQHTNDLFRLISRHNFPMNPRFWEILGRGIGLDRQNSLTKEILSRWVILLIKTIPNDIQQDDISAVLIEIGKCCIKHKTLDSLMHVFYAMTESRLQVKPYSSFLDQEYNPNKKFEVAVSPVGGHHNLQQLWEKSIKPHLADVAQPLLQRVVQCLEEQHSILNSWKQASPNDYIRNSYRSAIEPHEQDRYPYVNDVLIDVARDCLEWLILKKTEATLQWCDQSIKSEVSLLRRLAIHTISECKKLTADEKTDWLLAHAGLYDMPAHHEIFRAVKIAYAKASPEHRKKIIKSILDFSWPNGEESNREEETAYQHFNWLAWLQDGNSCELLQKALNDIKKHYPEFRKREHPDLLAWGSISLDDDLPSPLTAEELLAKLIDELLPKLLSLIKPEKITSIIRHQMRTAKILTKVKKAAEKNFEWGNNLANALANKKKWDVDIWHALMQAWQELQFNEDKYRQVIRWLGKTELHPHHTPVIAQTLRSLVEVQNESKPFMLTLLPEMNKLAKTLWRSLKHSKLSEENRDWLHKAINHPAGSLTEFWLFSLSLYREQQDPPPKTLNNEYRTILSTIIQESSPVGILGRSVLASEFNFLLGIDEKWTKDNLLPLFIKDKDIENFQAAWDGFLCRGHLNPAVAKLLEEAFLRTVPKIDETFLRTIPKIDVILPRTIPKIDEALLRAIPKIDETLLRAIPKIDELLPRTIPKIDVILPRTIPKIDETLLRAIPKIDELLPRTIPKIDVILPRTIPKIDETLLRAIPKIDETLLRAIPKIDELLPRTIPKIDENFTHNKAKFIQYYTTMLGYYVENPMDKWIPELFHCENKEIRLFFASSIGHHLRNLGDGKQQELWKRWLREYWKRRLDNIYAILEVEEIELMLEWWLPYLNSVFPEAVELAIQMPLASEQHFTKHKSELGKLLENHPEPLAKLLIYLGKWENPTPGITWGGTKEFIDKLLESNIPSPLKKELEELIVKLHLE